MQRAIIFDLYQTLVDFTSEDYSEMLHKMSLPLGIDVNLFAHYWNIETYKQRMTGDYPTILENLKDICTRLNIYADYNNIVKSANISLEYTEKTLNQFRDNVEYTLSELKNKNYKLGLLSDCSCNVPQIWNTSILSKYFDKTVFSCNANLQKPDNRLYQLLCSELSVQPVDCYYVGDWIPELIGALESGMTPIQICSSEEEDKNNSRQEGINFNIKKIFDIKDLLKIID